MLKDEPFEIILDAVHELHNGGVYRKESQEKTVHPWDL
jgi:hypothetical protein